MISMSEEMILTIVWGGILLFSGLLLLKLFAQAFLPEESWFARLMAHVRVGPAAHQNIGSDGYGSDGCGGDGSGGGD